MPRHGHMGPGGANEKAKDFKGTLKKLLHYMSVFKVQMAFIVIFAICGTVFDIVGPKILGKATTEIYNGLVSKVSGGSGMDFGRIGQILLMTLGLYLISALCSFIQGYLMTGVSQKTTYRLRKEISEKINRMPMNYFDTKPVGEVLSRVTNDIDTLGQSLNQSATQMITSVTTLIGVLAMMLSISPLMTLATLVILPVSMILISFVMKHSQKYFRGQQEYLGNVNGQVEEIYSGHNIIKAFNKEEDVIREFDTTNDRLYDSAWRSQFFSGMMMPIMQFIGNLGYVVVAILGGFLAIRKTIEVGDIQSFIQYVKRFTQPIQQIAQVAAKESLKGCDCMIGAKRLLEEVSDADCVCHAEYLPEKIEEYLRKHPQFCRIGIVLSGDAGFYSGAKKLEEVLNGSEERYEIQRIPGISSVVYFAAALHTSWEDAALVSLHGRWQNWIYEAEHHAKTFLLLGGRKENLKEKLLYYGLEDLTVHIGKNFSYPQEQIFSKTVSELTEEDTEGLCIVCLENPHPSQKVCRHLKDEAFTRGNVPMTKEEVRTICIAKLDLEKDAVLYDVGAGTGSVAVEAACQDGSIRVYAIEKNPEGIELIRKNVQKLRTDNVQIVEGTAPEALRKLEPPTHVFIGGSSGNLREILLAVKKKNPDVQIVLTAISLDTMAEVMEAVDEGLLREPEIVQITAAKARKLGRHHMMTGQNPIYIISEGEA